jgi:AbrB family looped-hinge helix DNA binding protein
MSYATSVITRKGQATIPIEIRRALGLEQGDRIAWTHENDHIRVERAQSVTERTKGLGKSDRHHTLDGQQLIDEETDAFERAVAAEVIASMHRS